MSKERLGHIEIERLVIWTKGPMRSVPLRWPEIPTPPADAEIVNGEYVWVNEQGHRCTLALDGSRGSEEW